MYIKLDGHYSVNIYAFGSSMPGYVYKHDSLDGYRFGFNCQEQEAALNDIYSFSNRIFDSRIAKFLSVDPLKNQNGLLASLNADGQRYFDLHHTANDIIQNVNKRELLLGAAAMTSIVFLIDKYGLQ